MSFSLKVKEELVGVLPGARHCQIAELAALISMCGHIFTTAKGRHYIRIAAENIGVIRKCQQIIKKAFGSETDVTVRYNSDSGNRTYIMTVPDNEIAIKILLSTKIMDTDGSFERDMSLVTTTGITNSCCKRAFLRGVFLAGGSISDPEKSYHLEIVASGMRKALQILDAMNVFELEGRIVERRHYYVVYLKEGSQIVDMLNVMGAFVSLMDLENVRVLKEVRNTINRKVNCETANLGKTVNAARKQIKDINYIKETAGLNSLSEELEEIAVLRLEYPHTPLKELGTMLSPPVGKSGVNHRLRKISEIADNLRTNKRDREAKK